MKKMKERLFAIKALIVALLIIISGVTPAMAGHGGPHYASVSVTAAPPAGSGKVYMTTDGDYVPEDEDWQNSMSATWNCGDGVENESDSRIYYVHAQPTSGNHFVKWSSNSSGSDSKSTDAKYAYNTSTSSTSSGSPTANSLYAIFAANPTYTCTLLTSENGTYKYKYGDSEEVTVASQHSVTTNQNFTFTALPSAGYTLYGWYTKSGSTKTYFDYTSTTISSYALPGNVSIGVDFVPVGTPIFQIKGTSQTYTDLNAAISACGSATKTIVLINNGTLPAGNYTIPANVTLLIPFDAGFTCYTATPELTTNSYITAEVYRTLTMAPGATLTVNGAVSVSAKLSSRSGYGPNGATSGKYGAIKMLSEGNTKSKITLNNGAKLYGWGYIYGEGAIEALSGSTVYEGFVIMDWRGGNNTLDMYNNKDKYKVFPFNQYYIQNIEVPLTIHKGATETVYSSVYGNGSDNPLSITMVGTSAGLFRLTGTGAKLTKWYDPFYDRQHYVLEGAAAINAISFTAMSQSVSSSDFVLPITNNMDITVRNGAAVSIAEDICIMPDASVTVEQGATVNIASGKNVYVYDIQAYTNADTYTTSRGGYPSAGPGRYAAGAYVRRISYSPSWAALSDREIRRLQNMSSAHFQVNGTLNVNGYLYTTEGGADIFSAADGAAVSLVSGAGTATKTYQVDHENYDAYYYTIPITSALLHNADGSYQATAGNAANTTWTYAHGHWGWCIIWRLEDGTELKRMYQPAQPNATWLSSNAPATTKPNDGTCSYVFNGWNTVTNTSQQEIILTADYTKTCAEYYDVLWKSEDGTVTYETDENVGKGETTRYNGAAPVKADDKINGFTYTFDGWTTQPNGGGTKYNIGGTPAATGNATYYAHFTATEVAAIVTANGVVSYYPSIADAFTAANASDYTPTIQVWRDAPNTPALTYTAKNHCTLDLNGHTVSGTSMPLLTINDEGFTFTVTDRTETKEGKLAGTSGVSQAFVVRLVSGVFRLEAGTVYGQNTGTGVMAGVYAGANREVIITGGTIQVDANSGTDYGIFAQGKGTINGGTIRVESSAKAAYAVQAQGANGNVTVTDGRFYAAGKTTVTCVLANGSASMTVNGGYYNTNTNLTTYLGAGRHIFNLPSSELPYKYKVGEGGYTVTFQNTDGTVLQSGWWENGATPEYSGDAPAKPGDTGGEFIHSGWTPELAPVTGDATYTATYVPTPPVASVTISGTTTNYIHFDDAWTAVNGATAASTLTLLQDVTVNSYLTYNNSSKKNCTFNLNSHTISTTDIAMFNLNTTDITFTITDNSEGQSGKVSVNSTSVGSTAYGVLVSKGRFVLAAGTIEANLRTTTSQGVRVANGASFTMNGGKIDLETTNNRNGDGVFVNTTGTATIGGGEIHVNAAATGYAVNAAGTTTITGGKFSAEGGTSAACVYRTGTLTLQGGYYSLNTNLADNCTTNYHVFPNSDASYPYKVAEGYTLSWSTDGDALTGNYTSGLIESGATIVAPATPTKAGCIFVDWSPAFTGTMPAASTTYTAQWAVASVTISGTTTLYTTFLPAWTAANSATAASTLTLLQDVTATTQLAYTNSNNQNCTFDLNGHTLTSNTSEKSPLHINNANVTFTVTDGTENKSGKLSLNSSSSSAIFGAYVQYGTLLLNAGTIEVISSTANTCGVTADQNGTFTMNGGTIHVKATNSSKEGRGVYLAGSVSINGGTVHVDAAGAGYGIRRDGGTVTVNNGKFNVIGSTAYATNQTSANASVVIRGGYYTTNSRLNPTAPYHVFGLDNQSPYLYEVAEGYTLTWTTDGDPLTGTYTSGVMKPGATITAPATPTKTGYTFSAWSPAVAETMPTENTEYTATWTANQYTITFDSNGGSEVASITQAYGTTVTPPADPFRLGYNFTDWTPAVPATMPIDGVTCTAQWEIIPYDISYTLDGGTESSANPTTYNVETPTFTLSNPTKEGYTFLGWTGSNGSTPQTAVSIASGSTGDKNYTANWAVNVASVTVNSATTYYTTFATAWTAANSATAAVTITLLQDISGLSSSRTYSASHNLTLDLNGHTLSGSGTSLFQVGCAGYTFTVTDGSANHDGKLSFTTAESSTSSFHCVIVNSGTFVLEAGTIEATSSTASIGAVQVAGGTFTMNEDGAVHVNYTGNVNSKNSRLVYANGGTTTINGGSIRLESKKDAIGVVYSNGNVTFNGGLFNISALGTAAVTNQTGVKNSLNIRGGYYSANSTGYFQPHVKTPYHIFSNSDATYIYRVAEAYNLTWATDGDALTGDYTSGYTEPGSTITAPATPTKTGYTFRAWSPAVAETMPAENTEYTATWTANRYTITFDSNGGSEVASITQDYGSAVTAPADPFRLGYNFTDWTPAVPATMPIDGVTCTAQWEIIPYDISYTLDGGTESSANPTTYNVETATFTLNNPTKEGYTFLGWTGSNGSTPQTAVSISAGSTGDKNYTANWAVNVASVTVNGATTYYTTIEAAWTAVNNATAASTLTLLQDVSITEYLQYNNSNNKNCMLNLNGHTLSSTTAQALIYINKAGITFTITDLTEGKAGSLHLETTGTGNRWCVYVANGNLRMDAGTVFLRSKANTYNEGIRIDPAASTFTMNGGKIHVVTSDGKPACGIVSRGIAVINGGEIQVEASGVGYGIEARVTEGNIGNVTVTGGKFLVTGTTAACAYRSNANATLKLQGGYYNSDTDLSTYCATNYHALPLTGEDPYKYEVAEAYTVTFNTNGHGTAPATQTIKKGGKATEPTAPTAEGYTFGGWYKEEACTNAWDFSTDVVNAATTLYAKWTIDERGDLLDIVDWSGNGDGQSLTLNMNGYSSDASGSNWKVSVAGSEKKTKDNRATNRTLVFSGLTLIAGEQITITAYDASDNIESLHRYTVPHIYTSDATLSSNTGFDEQSIVYVSAGTFTLNTDLTVKKMIVCPGAELVVNTGKTLTCTDLVLRTEAYSSAILTDNGTINATNVYYTRRVADKINTYPFGLPFNADISAGKVKLSNGVALTHGTHYGLLEYDGASRAQDGKADDTHSNWKMLTTTTLTAGQGYQLASTSSYYYELYFPVTYKKTTPARTVSVSYHTGDAGKMAAGWNYIVSPFTQVYDCESFDEPEELLKISVLDSETNIYDQYVPTSISPATPFFYQAEADGTLAFADDGLHKRAPRRMGIYNPSNDVPTQWVELLFGNAADELDIINNADRANIYLHPTKFSAEYELGYDVTKLSTQGARPLLWVKTVAGDLAFAALPDTLAQSLPLTVSVPAEGAYTFALNENGYTSRIDNIILLDALTGTETDLRRDTYTCLVEAGQTTARFFLNVKMKQQGITTEVDELGEESAVDRPVKLFIDGYIYILMPDGRMYDAVGKRVK